MTGSTWKRGQNPLHSLSENGIAAAVPLFCADPGETTRSDRVSTIGRCSWHRASRRGRSGPRQGSWNFALDGGCAPLAAEALGFWRGGDTSAICAALIADVLPPQPLGRLRGELPQIRWASRCQAPSLRLRTLTACPRPTEPNRTETGWPMSISHATARGFDDEAVSRVDKLAQSTTATVRWTALRLSTLQRRAVFGGWKIDQAQPRPTPTGYPIAAAPTSPNRAAREGPM